MAEDEKKKKKEPGIIERGKQIYGLGKSIYERYMAGRKRMAETRPPAPTTRKVQPPAPPEKEPQAAQPPKKKKKEEPRGGVGGVLDTIQERKKRMKEALEASD